MMTPNEQISIFLEIIADYRNANADLRQKKEELEKRLNAAKYCESMPDYESIIRNLKDELNMVSNSNNELLDQATVMRQENQKLREEIDRLKHALDERMTECDELKSKLLCYEGWSNPFTEIEIQELIDYSKDLECDNEELQADYDKVTMLNNKLLDENESLNTQVKVLMADKESLIQKLQNINDEYLILHNEKMKMEKELELLDTIKDYHKDEVWEENPYFK